MLIDDLVKRGLIRPPSWMPSNTVYLAITGSESYGVSAPQSDKDIVGVCVPPKDMVFLKGLIYGFDEINDFNQFQQHHINDKDTGHEYDVTVYNIVKFFKLLMDNNPNLINAIFVPLNCIIHSSSVGNIIRENRHIFLHKGVYFKMKSYAYQQLYKAKTKNPEAGSKRLELYEKYGMDVKFLGHTVRLLSECEQILTLGDLDIQKEREMIKSVRRGEWTLEKVQEYFTEKEKHLEQLYQTSTAVPHKPDKEKIKKLLLECLDIHYQGLKDVYIEPDWATKALREIDEFMNKYKERLYN